MELQKKQQSFNDLINGDKPVLVDFSAEWCGPCKAMSPILKEVAKEVGDRAAIVKIDVDKNPSISRKLEIQGVPTFILYQNGKAKWRQSGMQSAQALAQVINQAVENKL